jgi:hypothetical protein
MSSSTSSEKKILRGWAEISAFLKCGIRTAQRWAREEKLPVHRPNDLQQSIVHAFPRELLAWLSSREMEEIREAQTANSSASSPNSTPLDDLCVQARERASRIRDRWKHLG